MCILLLAGHTGGEKSLPAPGALARGSSKPGAWTEASACVRPRGLGGGDLRGVAAAGPSSAGDTRLPVVAARLRSGPAAQPLPARQLLGKATGALSPPHGRAPLSFSPCVGRVPVCRRPPSPQAPARGPSAPQPQTRSPLGLRGSCRPGQGGGVREATCRAAAGLVRPRRGGRALTWAPGPGPRTRSLALRTMANTERTFIAIKPDGVQRGLVGDIVKRFEQKGFRLVAMKFLRVRAPLPCPRSSWAAGLFPPRQRLVSAFAGRGAPLCSFRPRGNPSALCPLPCAPRAR